jgi:hypothetical protein
MKTGTRSIGGAAAHEHEKETVRAVTGGPKALVIVFTNSAR